MDTQQVITRHDTAMSLNYPRFPVAMASELTDLPLTLFYALVGNGESCKQGNGAGKGEGGPVYATHGWPRRWPQA